MGGDLAPVDEPRTGGVRGVGSPSEQTERHQLGQQTMDRRAWLAQLFGDLRQGALPIGARDEVEDLGRLSED